MGSCLAVVFIYLHFVVWDLLFLYCFYLVATVTLFLFYHCVSSEVLETLFSGN